MLWGANSANGELAQSLLLEGSPAFPAGHQVVSGRAEPIRKSGEPLALPTDQLFLVGHLSPGWRFDWIEAGPLVPGIEGTRARSVLSADL